MGRFVPWSSAPEPERAVLVGVTLPQSTWPSARSLDELARLAETAGAVVVGRLTQRLEHPVPRTFIGSGKVQELAALVGRLQADVVIFDDDLTPSQQSNLERILGEPLKIIDRTALILDIFGLHATTREGRLQVQLAQLEYLLPRLRGMWSHLAREQTRGGIGSRFGQGESQLEVDRRMVRARISQLHHELRELEKRRGVQAKERLHAAVFRVALAGYTNAGKSSLLNRLTGSQVLAEDKLFATLDPTTRAYVLPGGRAMTLTDTVGFIQKLPHGLVEAFKSTLAEVRGADLIIKVVDVADPDRARHIEAVEHVLNDIGAGSIPAVTVYNKVDLLDASARAPLAHAHPEDILFSAATGEGLETLCARIATEAARQDVLLSATVPYRESALVALVHRQGQVIQESYETDGVWLVCKVPAGIAARLARYRTDGPALQAR